MFGSVRRKEKEIERKKALEEEMATRLKVYNIFRELMQTSCVMEYKDRVTLLDRADDGLSYVVHDTTPQRERLNWDGIHGIENIRYKYMSTDVISFRIDERYHDNVQGGGSLGKALVGGALFGPLGAVLGGTGQGTQISKLTKLNINLYQKNQQKLIPFMTIKLLGSLDIYDTRSIQCKRVLQWANDFTQAIMERGAEYDGEEHKSV